MLDEADRDERVERGDDIDVGRERLGHRDIEPGRHGDGVEEPDFGFAQEAAAPVDDPVQRAMAVRIGCVDRADALSVQPVEDLRRCQDARPGGRELDRKWQAVKAMDEPEDVSGRRLVEGVDPAGSAGTADKELAGG